jgi:hypothetical protein
MLDGCEHFTEPAAHVLGDLGEPLHGWQSRESRCSHRTELTMLTHGVEIFRDWSRSFFF